jgi:hypothetical protein
MGASACDFDAMNAATTVDSHEYTAATAPAITSEDAPLDPTIEYELVGSVWIADTTGSVPEISYEEGLNAYGDPYFAY